MSQELGVVPYATLVGHLLACSRREVAEVLTAQNSALHYGVPVCLLSLAELDPAAASRALTHPRGGQDDGQGFLNALDAAIIGAQELLARQDPSTFGNCQVKESVHARLHSLPYYGDPSNGLLNPTIGTLRTAHIGRLLCLSGCVVRESPPRVLETLRQYDCDACGHRFTVHASLALGGTLQTPARCPAPGCQGRRFSQAPEAMCATNIQEIRVQEAFRTVSAGSVPRGITVLLQDDLVEAARCGDDVEITGTVMLRWQPLRPGAIIETELVFQAVHVRVLTQRQSSIVVLPSRVQMFQAFWEEHRHSPVLGRNKILASICPQMYGMFAAKLGLTLMLMGGVRQISPSGASVRGEIHMLVVGDPGTGKSQLLKWAARLSPRSVVTSGRGSSASGLTVAAVKEGGHWMLQAGALVLAHGGVCCIDEFDGIKEVDRAAMHEAMEQQTVSVAKAGLVTTLQTQASVFGVTNPKGPYDHKLPLASNINVAGPLLSRFDVVLLLLDTKRPDWDAVMSRHVVHELGDASGGGSSGWTIPVLQEYICWAQRTFQPTISDEAERLMQRYYQVQRLSEGRSSSRTTLRMVESLARLSQAHARLMARHEVELQDAVVAISLVEASMQDPIINHQQNVMHSGFEDDPDAALAELQQRTITAVGTD